MKFSIQSRFKSFKYAFNGLMVLLKFEHNWWIHILASVIVIIAGFVYKISRYDWSLLVIVIGMVWITESVNSAIETLADRVSSEKDELIKRTKDIAAAAVLISAIISVIVGAMVFIPVIIKN